MTVAEANRQVQSLTLAPDNFEIEDLLTEKFLLSHTDVKTAEEFFADVNFKNQTEFDNTDVCEFDAIVRQHSDYQSWIDFLQSAYCHRLLL